ncbi:MAG: endonuclease/exonuclease/phosphatase family protein [Clostridia bacterium]|nr:endonuclease/exonuclease/phosphatase family protein [Clostridia bacterium]
MKIVTFNLRYDNDGDGENRFLFRKGMILDRIEREEPDIIGFQEVLPHMAEFLRSHLRDYLCVGCGRGVHFDGENNMIAFRTDRFELMSLETFWLSETPDQPGSRYANQSDCPRVCTHVLLRRLPGTQCLHVFNTHLDHVSDEARILGATAIMKRVQEALSHRPAPVAIMGDMNAEPESGAIATFLNWKGVDLKNETPDFQASYHGFGRHLDHPQIDYIFSHGLKAIAPPVAWSEQTAGKYLSDHKPLCVNLDFNE